jgi:hypothetical protein
MSGNSLHRPPSSVAGPKETCPGKPACQKKPPADLSPFLRALLRALSAWHC